MSERPDDAGNETDDTDESLDEIDDAVETPFDHPFFLPAILLGLSLWFFWDGFVVPMEEHLTFNRWGFAVLATLTLWFGRRAILEMREDRENEEGGPRSDGDDQA